MRSCRIRRSRGRKAENLFKSDDDAVFEKVYDINLDEIKPVVARPHQIDDVVDAKRSQGCEDR